LPVFLGANSWSGLIPGRHTRSARLTPTITRPSLTLPVFSGARSLILGPHTRSARLTTHNHHRSPNKSQTERRDYNAPSGR